jgi:integrase/recombinase XerD
MKIPETITDYLNHLQTIGRSPRTIQNAHYELRYFYRYLEQEKIYEIESLTQEVLADYQEDLAFSLTAKGKLLTLCTQIQRLGVVKGFTRFLKLKDYLLHDPAEALDLPRKPQRLPKVILNEQEIQKLLNGPDLQTNRGYRNRIILEILYDTAVRRAELGHIKLQDLDLESGFIHIRGGKGNKDRVVMVRPHFLNGSKSDYLVLNRFGQSLDGRGIWNVIKHCVKESGLKKEISTHTLRHTCATHMLRNGAPIRHLQEMLGHESLESTQVYTHVTINDLKQIHAKYHPSEKNVKGDA